MIKGKRALLGNFFYHSGFYHGLRYLENKSLVIFNYHRIRKNADDIHDFDDGVFGPTAEEFRAHLEWLKLNTDIISENELIDHVRDQKPLSRSSVMITFDDGYRDNADIALPILQELEIPATFFISTEAIETRELGWWDKIAYLLKNCKKDQITLRDRIFDLRLERELAIKELQEWMRTQSSDRTQNLMNELSHACNVALPGINQCSSELMTWDQIRKVQAAGMTIGSHTHTHRVLSTLTLSEQYEEFRISKKILEDKLGQSIRSVAYPVGGHEDWHLETGEIAERCGYEIGFSFQTGANQLNKMNRFEIARVPAEDTIPMTCAAVTLPSIFARSRTGERPTRSLLSSFKPVPLPKMANSTQTQR